jgi:molybdopterin synthase catalytic subunit
VADGVVRLVGIRDTPLSIDEVVAAVADPTAGGTAVFIGTVRDDDGGREVSSLGYEAHPDAVTVFQQVAAEVAKRHGVIALGGVHRVGLLEVGDLAVVVAAACAHRGESFAAAQDFIDEVKERVPIWKRQTFADGEVQWVGVDASLH